MRTVRILIAALALVCAGTVLEAAYCHGKPQPNVPNTQPVYSATTTAQLLRTTSNAKVYVVGSADDTVHLVHLWGSSGAEFGAAYGTIMRDEIRGLLNTTWAYLEKEVAEGIEKSKLNVPAWLADLIAEVGLDAALDASEMLMKPFADPQVYDEMAAMSKAAGVDPMITRRIHLLGDLTRGRCSMFGAWGNALSKDGMIQMRALDWVTDATFQNYPVVVVYHPLNDASGQNTWGHAFANVGWAGFVGSLTGVSSTQLGVSEIGVSFPDIADPTVPPFGDESRVGIPFPFLLRDVLQKDESLSSAMTRMANAHRTCRLILGVGDGKLERMTVVQYSHSNISFYDDTDLQPLMSWHPRIADVVYEGMDWGCPAFQQQLHDRIVANYGKIDLDVAKQDIAALTTTGDLHIAFYDLKNLVMRVANARADGKTGGSFPAYDRAYIEYDLKALFNEPQP
eukprot:ANDGO_02687.mRNA.1 Protein dcd1A